VADLTNRTDRELLRLTATEPEAFAVFYRRHVGVVLAYLRARTSDVELTIDLAAETFARALEHADRFRADGPNARPWLYAIARNLLFDSFRHGRVESDARLRLGLEPIVLTDAGYERVEEMADAARDISPAVLDEELSKAQARAVEGRVLGERSYEALAAQLQCSPQVVRQHVSRGLRILRRNRKVIV
jgi:RNA polymerase sigma factor (sigma-70 family)